MDVVICVPGKWNDKEEFVSNFNQNSIGFGADSASIEGQEYKCEYLFYDFDPNLIAQFSESVGDSMGEDDIMCVADHTFSVYLLAKVKSYEHLNILVGMTNSVLESGGIAVRVENSNLVHSKKQWNKYAQSLERIDFFNAFVALIPEKNKIYSLGMRFFELPDAEIVFDSDAKEKAYKLIHNFLIDMVIKNEEVFEGQQFSIYGKKPNYELRHFDDKRHEKGTLRYNKYGIWKFVKI